MIHSRRRENRRGTDMTLSVFMRDEKTSTIIAGPVSCFVRDLSSYGAGLILEKVQFDGYHLFYTPTEKVDCKLYLAQDENEKDQVIIPVKPIWYKLDEIVDMNCFHLGVEFLVASNDPHVVILKKIAKEQLPGKEQSWLGKRLAKLWPIR